MRPSAAVLVDDDVVRQGKLLAVRDDRLEALDEEDDVDLGTLRLRVDRDGGSSVDYGTAAAGIDRRSWARVPSRGGPLNAGRS